MFVGVTTAANAGVPVDKAGLAASLLNASQQVGGALGLAIFTAIATSRTQDLLAAHAPVTHALTAGFQRALWSAASSSSLRRDRAPRHQHPRRGGPSPPPRRTARARTSISENACIHT